MQQGKTMDLNDDPPNDPEQFRAALVRRIYNFLGAWRECTEPSCKRARACVARNLACAARHPKSTPEEHQIVRNELWRALQKARGARGDGDDGAAKAGADAPAGRDKSNARTEARGLTRPKTSGRCRTPPRRARRRRDRPRSA